MFFVIPILLLTVKVIESHNSLFLYMFFVIPILLLTVKVIESHNSLFLYMFFVIPILLLTVKVIESHNSLFLYMLFVIAILLLTVKVTIQRMEDGKLSISLTSHTLFAILFDVTIFRLVVINCSAKQCFTCWKIEITSSSTKLPLTKRLQFWTVSA